MRNAGKTALAVIAASLLLPGIVLAQGTLGSGQSEAPKAPAPSTVPPAGSSTQTETPTVPRGATKASRTAKGSRHAKPMAGQKAIKAVQEALKEKGHDPGPIDGVMGPKTSAALKDFQKSQGLPATGQPDTATRAKLGV